MKYIVYDPSNGKIIGLRMCAPGEIDRNVPPGARYIEGWVDGPARIDLQTMQVVHGSSVDDRTIERAREQKWNQIKSARMAANRGTFEFAGKRIYCDELSRSDIDGVNGEVSLTGSLPASFPLAWKAADNTFVPIPTVAAWTQFYQAMVSQGAANFAKSQAILALIQSAQTVAEVDAITWDSVP